MDRIGTDSTIGPGSTFEYDTSISSPGYALVVSAVVFDDNTSQGNPEHLRQVRDYRRGQRTQIARIQRIFKDLASLRTSATAPDTPQIQVDQLSRNEEPETSLSSLFTQAKQMAGALLLRALPEHAIGTGEEEVGLRDAKELAIIRLQELESSYIEGGFFAFQEASSRLQAQYNGRFQALSRALSTPYVER